MEAATNTVKASPDFGGYALLVQGETVLALDLETGEESAHCPSDCSQAEYDYLLTVDAESFTTAAYDINPDIDPARRDEDNTAAADWEETKAVLRAAR